MRTWVDAREATEGRNAVVDMGWGRLIFGQTFADPRAW
jgi:hypothetical protein